MYFNEFLDIVWLLRRHNPRYNLERGDRDYYLYFHIETDKDIDYGKKYGVGKCFSGGLHRIHNDTVVSEKNTKRFKLTAELLKEAFRSEEGRNYLYYGKLTSSKKSKTESEKIKEVLKTETVERDNERQKKQIIELKKTINRLNEITEEQRLAIQNAPARQRAANEIRKLEVSIEEERRHNESVNRYNERLWEEAAKR